MLLPDSSGRTQPLFARLVAPVCMLVTVTTAGCAHYSAASLDTTHTASGSAQQREVDGLYVAVESLVSSQDSVTFFERDLPAYGYLPVLLLLEMDKKSNATFDVSRHDLRLALADGTRLEPVEPKEIATTVRYSHWRTTFGFIPLIIPGFFVASSVGEANEALLHDYNDKALESARLNPNARSYRGVLFFRTPEGRAGSAGLDDAFLEVKIYRRGQSGELDRVFDLPVHFDS